MANNKKVNIGLVGVGAIIILVLLTSYKSMRSNRGSAGLGDLIMFIAVILVAAIAAAVFISTGGSLQQRALVTGNEAREGISQGLEAVSIRGMNPSQSGPSPHRITQLQVMARLPAGSSTLSLNNTVIALDTTLASQSYTYNGVVTDSITASGTSDFVVTYVKSGPNHQDGYVSTGDMVNIKINIDGQMGENMKGRLSIIPRAGSMNQMEFQTPETMTDPVVVVWPMR